MNARMKEDRNRWPTEEDRMAWSLTAEPTVRSARRLALAVVVNAMDDLRFAAPDTAVEAARWLLEDGLIPQRTLRPHVLQAVARLLGGDVGRIRKRNGHMLEPHHEATLRDLLLRHGQVEVR